MRGERPPMPERRFIEKTWEIDPRSAHDREKTAAELKEILGEEAAEQLVFAMQQVVSVKDFANHCNHATQELGKALDERFGGEESFFDLATNTRYRDVRSETTLEKVGYRGLFHSVGIVSAGDARRPISIIIDLTHFTVNGSRQKERSALMATVAGNEAAALQKLGHIYGGHWTAHFAYDSKKKVFKAIE